MNLSGDSSSDDDSVQTAKRRRVDNYRASSASSAVQESDEGSPPPGFSYACDKYEANNIRAKPVHFQSGDEVSTEYRESRSSLGANSSSQNDESDDYRSSGYRDKDGEDESDNPCFQTSGDNAFYNRKSDDITCTNSDAKTNYGNYSEFSKKMMSSMGYKPGKGLGKFEHGRVEPVEASTQKGRRGLGAKPSIVGDIPKDFKWDQDQSTPEATERVVWLPDNIMEPLNDAYILEKWLRLGPKKLTIDDETNFVDPQILQGVLNSKSIFDSLQDEDMRKARFRSNPYETIGSVIFLNRAAVKMANIDALFDFMFTVPKDETGKPVVDKENLLYFADVCAGPGGFSEYVLYRRGWRAKGFGFTLKGSNDFKLGDFYAGSPETFIPYYGVKNDGNIFDPANLSSLKEFVIKQTDSGVHFLMADGGFSVEGQENIQEILSKQLYLCQCLAALMLVRTGGNFVVKLFDVFTRFSVGLIYLMYKCFKKVCIHKPVTSRPANSERYLVCLWKKAGVEAVENYLFSVNSKLWKNRGNDNDVTELVSMSVLCEDKPFFDYIYSSNCSLGERQIKNLLKIAEFSKHSALREENQANMKEECLKLWKIPNKVRLQPKFHNPDETVSQMIEIMRESNAKTTESAFTLKNNFANNLPHYMEQTSDLEVFKNVYDWHYTFLSSTKGSPELKVFLGCGGKQVYQLDGTLWKNVANLHITMPAKTLIYAEVVKEFRGEGNTQVHNKALHIVDAMMLGGVDISHESLTERVKQCALFCKALENHVESDGEDQKTLQIRFKRFYNMESFPSDICDLEYRAMKRIRQALTVQVPRHTQNSDHFFIVGSILFVKELKDPWVSQISKKSNAKYYFGIGPDKKPRSLYTIPDEAKLDMMSAYNSRVMWPWGEYARGIFEGQINSRLTRSDMEDFIKKKL